jgi:ABC-type branched-subunit amino acid transport system substrate-binding protein
MLSSIFQARVARPEEIAFFTQQDAFGDAIFKAGIKVIREYGFKQDQVILHLRYPRNTVCVTKAVARLLLYHPQPRVIIMGGTYAPCARFIRLARKYGFRGVFMAVSFVGPEALADKVEKAGERTLITQVVPPYSLNLPIIEAYKKDMKLKYKNFTPSFVSLEGYIASRILIKGLKRIKGEINRETVIHGLESLGRFDLGLGVPLFLSPHEHQASHYVWPTVIRQGKVVPSSWHETARLERTVRLASIGPPLVPPGAFARVLLEPSRASRGRERPRAVCPGRCFFICLPAQPGSARPGSVGRSHCFRVQWLVPTTVRQ